MDSLFYSKCRLCWIRHHSFDLVPLFCCASSQWSMGHWFVIQVSCQFFMMSLYSSFQVLKECLIFHFLHCWKMCSVRIDLTSWWLVKHSIHALLWWPWHHGCPTCDWWHSQWSAIVWIWSTYMLSCICLPVWKGSCWWWGNFLHPNLAVVGCFSSFFQCHGVPVPYSSFYSGYELWH